MASLVPSVWNQCAITNLERPAERVEAHFNPHEITLQKKIPWSQHRKTRGDAPTLEFTNAEAETLSVELFFDTYEEKQDVYQRYIEPLRSLTLVDRKATGEGRRPPRVLLSWGDKKFLDFKGVITSMTVKYSLFLPDGTPVRATCALELQQVAPVKARVGPPVRKLRAPRYTG